LPAPIILFNLMPLLMLEGVNPVAEIVNSDDAMRQSAMLDRIIILIPRLLSSIYLLFLECSSFDGCILLLLLVAVVSALMVH